MPVNALYAVCHSTVIFIVLPFIFPNWTVRAALDDLAGRSNPRPTR